MLQRWTSRDRRHDILTKICSNHDLFWVVLHVHDAVALIAMIDFQSILRTIIDVFCYLYCVSTMQTT